MPERPHRSARRTSLGGGSASRMPLNRRPSPMARRLSPSSSPRHQDVGIEMLKRWSTEPQLPGLQEPGVPRSIEGTEPEDLGSSQGVLIRPHTCTDIFGSSHSLVGSSSRISSEEHKDTKVIMNVTVEGSPGPVKVLVKLSSTVEEAIKLVVGKYREEGRTPKLDPDSASAFELHHSKFSLQSLDRSQVLDDLDSRNFYLRTHGTGTVTSGSFTLDAQSQAQPSTPSSPQQPRLAPLLLFPSMIAEKIRMFIERSRKFFRMLVCL